MADMASLQAIVHGRVQGVFFRAYVEDIARQLNLTGWVSNRPGGVVEVIAEGDRSKLEKMVEYLNVGPPAAKVSEIVTTWGDYTGDYSRFNIRY